MKNCIILLSFLCCAKAWGQKKDFAIKEVNFTQVKLSDKFWLPRIETNRTVTIPASFERCESVRVPYFHRAGLLVCTA